MRFDGIGGSFRTCWIDTAIKLGIEVNVGLLDD